MSRDVSEGRKYRQIADDLRAAIDAGTYVPGDRLPGENVLMGSYGVARMTARQALAALAAEGLTTTRQGVGVFVREFRPVIRKGTARLSSQQWTNGRGPWDAEGDPRPLTVDELTITEGPADAETAALLDIEPGSPVVTRSRRYLLAERPVMRAVSHLPAELAAGTAITKADTGPGGIYARLAEIGHAPARFREDVRARMATADEAASLNLDAGIPILHIIRTAATETGRPVEVNHMTLDASSYVLRYDFEA
jgi:GntR family transcriptional regulator